MNSDKLNWLYTNREDVENKRQKLVAQLNRVNSAKPYMYKAGRQIVLAEARDNAILEHERLLDMYKNATVYSVLASDGWMMSAEVVEEVKASCEKLLDNYKLPQFYFYKNDLKERLNVAFFHEDELSENALFEYRDILAHAGDILYANFGGTDSVEVPIKMINHRINWLDDQIAKNKTRNNEEVYQHYKTFMIHMFGSGDLIFEILYRSIEGVEQSYFDVRSEAKVLLESFRSRLYGEILLER